MNIKILGTGCPNCQKLEAKVEKVSNISEIMGYGVMGLPAIVVDEKVISYGTVPSVEEIKKLLTK